MVSPVLFGQPLSRRVLAALTTVMMAGSLVPLTAISATANPRYQSYELRNPGRAFNTPNPYPYAPRSDYRVSQQSNPDILELPRNTLIPISSQEDSLTLKKGETRSISLRVKTDLRQRNGQVIVPAGSEIVGQFQPTISGEGVQFRAQQLILPNGQYLAINAQSRELVGFQVQNRASAADVIKGTLAGAGTATVVAGTTGDRRINALEVLGGAAVGALAGWGLPSAGILGGGGEEILTIDPNKDLTLVLQTPLRIDTESAENAYYSQSQNRRWRSQGW